jgi:hypothetical protein
MPIGISPLSNANAPQLCDLGRAAGFGVSLWIQVIGGTAAPNAEFIYGTHAAAIHNAQVGGRVYAPVVAHQAPITEVITALTTNPQYVEPIQPVYSKIPLATEVVLYPPIRPTIAAPQYFDFTLQAQVNIPVTQQGFVSSQYTYGTHADAMYNSQTGGIVIATATAPAQTRALRAFQAAPQTFDYTLQGLIPFVPVPTGFLVNMAASAPQYFDFTLQPWQTNAVPTPLTQGPKIPTPVYGVPLQDQTQIAAQFYKPPVRSIPGISPEPIYGRQDDTTQIAARVYAALPSGAGKYVQPALISIPQQAYIDVPQGVVEYPLVGSLPVFKSITGASFTFSSGNITAAIAQLTGIFDYFTLAKALLDFSHRIDIANYFDYYIQQAETRIYRDLFAENIGNGVKWLEAPFTATTTQGAGTALPSGYLALKTMQVSDLFGNVHTLLYKDPQWMYTNYPLRQQQQMPAYVARDGSQFIFGPSPDTVYNLTGTYYAQSAALSSTNPTTWMTTVCPDLLLAACMIELQPFLKDVKALKVWRQIYATKLVALVNLDQSERVSAGTMSIEFG